MATGRYTITSKGHVVYVVLEGVFDIDKVKSYEKALKQHVLAHQIGTWLLVADVNGLEASPMEAVKYTEQITNWILSNRCQGIINVHNLNESIIDFQLAIAAGDNKIFNAKTEQDVQGLISELKQTLDITE